MHNDNRARTKGERKIYKKGGSRTSTSFLRTPRLYTKLRRNRHAAQGYEAGIPRFFLFIDARGQRFYHFFSRWFSCLPCLPCFIYLLYSLSPSTNGFTHKAYTIHLRPPSTIDCRPVTTHLPCQATAIRAMVTAITSATATTTNLFPPFIHPLPFVRSFPSTPVSR